MTQKYIVVGTRGILPIRDDILDPTNDGVFRGRHPLFSFRPTILCRLYFYTRPKEKLQQFNSLSGHIWQQLYSALNRASYASDFWYTSCQKIATFIWGYKNVVERSFVVFRNQPERHRSNKGQIHSITSKVFNDGGGGGLFRPSL